MKTTPPHDPEFSFHAVTVVHRPTGEASVQSPFCGSDGEAVRLVRLTFASPTMWGVTAGSLVVPQPGSTAPIQADLFS